MKRCISDYIEKLDNEDLYLFLGNNVSYETAYDKSIVIFSHEFTRTGAPTVLLDLVEVLVRNEYCVFVVSEIGGELRNDFIECGANLIIYPEYMNNSSWMEKVSKLFDVFLVNTLLCTFTVSALADKVTSVYWWIHESEIWFEKLTNIRLGVAHASATRFLAASTKVQGLITKYFGVESEVLNFCVKETEKSIEAKDCAESELVDKSKITFLQVGSVDYNKGQEILADAIMSLSPEEMERSEFIFCGKTDRADEVILNKIENTVNKCSNVKLLPAIPREELFSLYDDVDVIIVPSYSETTSAIAVEAFMKKKICICSDGCGICEYITDGQDALIFKSGNMQALKDKISYVIEHFSDLSYVAGNGRKIYEKYYKEDIFEKKVLSLLKVSRRPS